MKASRQAADGNQRRRLLRTPGAVAIAVALCVGTSACANDLLAGTEADATTKEKHGQRAQSKPTEKSVRTFYARASKAYRSGDVHQLCRMTARDYAAEMVEEAAAAGLEVSTCPEVWQLAIDVNPQGHQDTISRIAVKERSATFLSGNDPWRLRLVRGHWRIVHS